MNAAEDWTASVSAMINATQLSRAELSLSLGISESALEQRRLNGKFYRSEHAKVVRIALVLERAQRVFSDRAQGLTWLKHPNRVLFYSAPLDLLGSKAGLQRVLAALSRIEDGSFA